MDNREDSSTQSDAAENTVDGTWLESRFSNAEGDVTKEEHLGAGSDKKAPRNRFHLFHHKQKKPRLSTDAPSSSRARDITEAPKQSAHSHGVTSENRISQLQDEQALAELTELLINPSKVHQRNGNAVMSVPPAQAPEGHAVERPIHPRGGTGNEETDGEKGVEASKALPLQQEVSGSSLGPSQEYIVQVTLDSGHNLAIRDKSGSSDPYVKFKQEHFKYKSAVINQNLNPQWNEIVSFKTTDLASPLQMQVFDHDYGSADDFMGAASVNLDEFADGQVHTTDVGLSDPHCSNENLGYIRLFIKIDRNDRKLSIDVDDGSRGKDLHGMDHTGRRRQLLPPQGGINQRKNSSYSPKGILTVTLLDGTDLPAMDENGFSDPYCKISLGSQKYKSKVPTPITSFAPPITSFAPPITSFAPPITSFAPLITSFAPPITSFAPPITSFAPPITSFAPPITSFAPPITSFAPPITSFAPPITSFAPPITSFAPPITSFAPPITSLAPPIFAIATTTAYTAKAVQVKFKTLNPKWKEEFDFRVFEGDDTLNIEVWDRDFPSADDYMGVCNVELGTLVPDKTYDLTLPLVDSECGSIHLLLCLSGMAVNKMDECDDPQNDVTEESYGWMSSLKLESIKDVGQLKVKICEISGVNIGGNANLFVTLEVGNSQMRTDIVYKCASPMWNKTFCLDEKRIQAKSLPTLFNVMRNGDVTQQMGDGTPRKYELKDKHCIMKAKAEGLVKLECYFVYNHVLMSNIRRATYLGRTLLSTWHFIQSLWSWEDKWLSAISFFLFVVACLLAEVWMVFPLLLLLLLYGYMVVYVRGHHLWQIDSRRKSRHRDEDDEESSMEELEGSELEDEGDPAAEDQSKAGIRKKFKQLQRVLLLLQTLLGQLADLGERIHNFCHWRVPWLCWLAITVLTVAMVIVYFIPLRYVILAWGVNKFTKKLRKPHYIPNQALLNFISRAPTYKQLHLWSEVPTIGVERKTGKAHVPSSSDKTLRSAQ
eukprot:Em0096g12a